ncbi:MAG: hypothetical protein ACTSVB_08600 [Candidatus Heimdallarchaeaceae archaeon]
MKRKSVEANLLKSLSILNKGLRKKNKGNTFRYFSSLNSIYLYETFNCFELSVNAFSNSKFCLTTNSPCNVKVVKRGSVYE